MNRNNTNNSNSYDTFKIVNNLRNLETMSSVKSNSLSCYRQNSEFRKDSKQMRKIHSKCTKLQAKFLRVENVYKLKLEVNLFSKGKL